MPTILEALTGKSVARDLNNSEAVTGPNTLVDTEIFIEQWFEWTDFTYENIKAIFKKQLGQKYQGDSEPRPLPQDLYVVNEDTTDDAMRRFPIPIVNYALSSVEGTEHFGRGSRCRSGDYIPDWSLVARDHVRGKGGFMNILPGDTKVSSKWTSTMMTNPTNMKEWEKVLSQVVTYMAAWSTRYGFIITDMEVVVLRITREYIPSGLATGRPRRTVRLTTSNATITLSSDPLSDPLSDRASDASSVGFQDTEALNWDFIVEYRAIPWSAKGSDRLTAKLALWALAMMSSHGDHFIDYSYPKLNTWRVEKGGIVHNTSGAVLVKAGKDCIIQQRNPFWNEVLARAGEGDTHDDSVEDDDDDDDEEEDEEEDLYGDDAGEDAAYEEPDLPEFSRAASTALASSSTLPDAQPSQATTVKKITVKVQKIRNTYFYQDYKDRRTPSKKDDWKAVEGGYLLRGKKYNYFTKKLG